MEGARSAAAAGEAGELSRRWPAKSSQTIHSLCLWSFLERESGRRFCRHGNGKKIAPFSMIRKNFLTKWFKKIVGKDTGLGRGRLLR